MNDVHVLLLVGTDQSGLRHEFYRWATDYPVPGWVGRWHIECSCQWRSTDARWPAELIGPGFVHLLLARLSESG